MGRRGRKCQSPVAAPVEPSIETICEVATARDDSPDTQTEMEIQRPSTLPSMYMAKAEPLTMKSFDNLKILRELFADPSGLTDKDRVREVVGALSDNVREMEALHKFYYNKIDAVIQLLGDFTAYFETDQAPQYWR